MLLNDINMKEISGFEGYLVDEEGNIYSEKTGRFLSQSFTNDGYLKVGLTKDGKVFTKAVHRLVAEAFIPNPTNLPEVNHIDENKVNNVVDNLEWCDSKYNCNYGTRNERMASSKLNGNSKKVRQLDLDDNFIREWPSVRQVERECGYNQAAISRAAIGKQKTAYGYKWKYA